MAFPQGTQEAAILLCPKLAAALEAKAWAAGRQFLGPVARGASAQGCSQGVG